MIIYKDKALAIINSKNIPNLWLIFGTDEGEIDLMIKKIIEKVKSESSELITIYDHSELYNSMSARSLFHLNKIIVLSGITDAVFDTINSSINLLKSEDYCIFKGGDLKKTSKLRGWFESHESAIALNCYKLDSHSILPIIESGLRRHNIIFDREIPQLIAGMVSIDSRVIYNEIEKIALFLADSHDRKLTVQMVEDIISCSAEISLDGLFAGIVLKNQKVVSHQIELIDNYIFVIRAYQNYLQRLISAQKDLGRLGIDGVMNRLKPPLFGRNKTEFIEVIKRSLLEENISRLHKIIELECEVKTLPVDQKQLLIQRIYEMVLD
jgi:DNA polymerase III delta subunit